MDDAFLVRRPERLGDLEGEVADFLEVDYAPR